MDAKRRGKALRPVRGCAKALLAFLGLRRGLLSSAPAGWTPRAHGKPPGRCFGLGWVVLTVPDIPAEETHGQDRRCHRGRTTLGRLRTRAALTSWDSV